MSPRTPHLAIATACTLGTLVLIGCGGDDRSPDSPPDNAASQPSAVPAESDEGFPSDVTRALSERGYEFEAVADLPAPPTSDGLLSQKEAQDLPDETVAIAGVSTPLPGGTGYIYEFETSSLAAAAIPSFDSNGNAIEGCGSYVFYSNGKPDAADRWRQEVGKTLEALDSECRDGSTFGIA